MFSKQLRGIAFAGLTALGVVGLASGAHADPLWTISNAPLSNGDFLSGQIQVNQYGYLQTSQFTLFGTDDTTVLEQFGGPNPAIATNFINGGGGGDSILTAFAGSYTDWLHLEFSTSLHGNAPDTILVDLSFVCLGSFSCDVGTLQGTSGDPSPDQTFFTALNEEARPDVSVPEPASLTLLGFGLLGAGLLFARRRKMSTAI